MKFRYADKPSYWADLLVAVVLVLVIALSTVGCAGMAVPADPAKMTAEQLKAAAQDRSAIAACTTVAGPWGTGRTIYVQLDKGTFPTGSVTVTQDCQVGVTAESVGKGVRP